MRLEEMRKRLSSRRKNEDIVWHFSSKRQLSLHNILTEGEENILPYVLAQILEINPKGLKLMKKAITLIELDQIIWAPKTSKSLKRKE